MRQRCRWVEASGQYDCPGGTLTANGSFVRDESKRGELAQPHSRAPAPRPVVVSQGSTMNRHVALWPKHNFFSNARIGSQTLDGGTPGSLLRLANTHTRPAVLLPSCQGAGYYPAGNPDTNPAAGGGSGCHFAEYDPPGIDQTDAANASHVDIVKGRNCQCNDALSGNTWGDWVSHWISFTKPRRVDPSAASSARTHFQGSASAARSAPTSVLCFQSCPTRERVRRSTRCLFNRPDYKWMGWFKGGKLKAPSFALSFAACWLDNLRDTINLQNAIWVRTCASRRAARTVLPGLPQ